MRNRIAATLAAAALTLSAAAFATAAPAGVLRSNGKLTKIDVAHGKLRLQNGNADQRFEFAATTPCTDHGTAVPLTDLKPGTKLLVEWSDQKGKSVVSKIEVIGAASDAQGSH
ncbi:MAG: hypothetical protein U0X73_17020 [Thermoanaerobaculia bacterium]